MACFKNTDVIPEFFFNSIIKINEHNHESRNTWNNPNEKCEVIMRKITKPYSEIQAA